LQMHRALSVSYHRKVRCFRDLEALRKSIAHPAIEKALAE